MIINIENKSLQSMSTHPNDNWMGGGWALVPPELEKTALQLTPYCALVFDAGGALTGITDDGTRPQETAEDPDYGEFLKGLYEEATNHE